MCALLYSTIMTPNIRLTQHLHHVLSNGDTLYQQTGKWLALYIPTYICMYNCKFKVYEKQSTIGYINWCNDKYCMIALADAYRILDNNQHCILCLGDAACTISTVANGTYYMFHTHSCDVMEFQNDMGTAVFLYFQT